MAFDFKKEYKEFYMPEKLKTVIRHPIKVKGAGCPVDIRLAPTEVERRN